MSMKTSTSILALTAFFIFGTEGVGGAYAADLGRGGMKDSVIDGVPAASISWTGFFIGGTVGIANNNHKIDGAYTQTHCGEGNVVANDGQCYDKKDIDFAGSKDGILNPKTGATAVEDPTFVTTDVAGAFVDGFNSHGLFGGGTVGGDVQLGRIVLGGFVDYNFSGAKTKAGAHIGEAAADASIEDGDSWVAAARAGYLFGDEKRTLLYVLGGYGQQDTSYGAGINEPGTSRFSKDVTFSGFVAGGGIEYALARNISIALEYQHFFGGKETIFDSGFVDGDADRLKITDDLDSDKIMLKAKLKLNGGLFGY